MTAHVVKRISHVENSSMPCQAQPLRTLKFFSLVSCLYIFKKYAGAWGAIFIILYHYFGNMFFKNLTIYDSFLLLWIHLFLLDWRGKTNKESSVTSITLYTALSICKSQCSDPDIASLFLVILGCEGQPWPGEEEEIPSESPGAVWCHQCLPDVTFWPALFSLPGPDNTSKCSA